MTVPTIVGAFDVRTLAERQQWKAAGGTDTVEQAAPGDLQPNGWFTPLDPGRTKAFVQRLLDNQTTGLRSVIEFALQYTNDKHKSGSARLVDQFKQPFVSTEAADVLDFVWDHTTQAGALDFIEQVYTALPAAVLPSVRTFRLGGLYYGELHYPPVANGKVRWYGFSPAAQTQCPPGLLGYVPFQLGGNPSAKDIHWVRWYVGGLVRWLQAQIDLLRQLGWGPTRPLYVLFPGFGLRFGMALGSSQYQEQAAEGVDFRHFLDGLPPNVLPWPTWLDDKDPWPGGTADTDTAPWRLIFAETRLRGKAGPLIGEITGGQSNADMDRLFSASGALGLGYTGLFWLSFQDLVTGRTGATLAHLTQLLKGP